MGSNSVLSCMIMIIVSLTTVKAKSTNFSYTITCDPNSRTDCQNETLDTILNSIKEVSEHDVHIDLNTTQLQLNKVINLTGLNSLTIIGKPDIQTSVICTPGQNVSTGPGVVLRNINGLVELSNLNLAFCGSEIDTEFNGKIYISALTILHCRNVQLSNITIERSRGIGLMVVNYLGGNVNIESGIFRENNLHSDYYKETASDSKIRGGGGVYIVQQPYHLPVSTVTVLQFQNCTFENNTANTSRHDHLYTNVQGKAREGYGRGGGVYVLFSNDIANVSVLFLSCIFSGNQAFIGSGLAVRIQGDKSKKTTDIQVTIMDSIFRRNGCDDNKHIEQGIGGGAHLTFDSYLTKSNNIINCSYTLENVHFVENCAELGGGVNHISGKRSVGDELSSNSITFDNCSFEGNKAHMGSAIFLATSIDRRISSGHSTMVKFFDCLFTCNAVLPAINSLLLSQITYGVGTVYISSYNVRFSGDTIFTKNTGSALHVINGLVNFQNSSALFENNTALLGGALALIGSSIFIVGPNKRYEFTGNSATYKGGAIYVAQINNVDFISSDICFIQCVDENNSAISWDWNNTIIFTGNHAKDSTAGHTIYATSLHPCQSIYSLTATGSANYTLVDTSEVFNIRGIKFDKEYQNNEAQIATDGAVLNTSKSTIDKSMPLGIIPGERYEHNVTVTDDLNQTINASFWTVFSPEEGEEINISLASNFSTVITDTINIRGKPNQKAILYMNLLSARQTYIQLNMEVLDCPPGFKLNDKSECVCNTNAHVGMYDCDRNRFRSHLISGYWAGYLNDSQNEPKLVTSACPFCDYSLSESGTTTSKFEVILPRNRPELDKSVCGGTRTGTVCGKCRKGYTVHFHSPGFLCKPAEPVGCKLGWLFYILSELVPVTVVFITVLVLNISFTSGAVNGFILFSQLLASLDLTAAGIITFPLEALKNASQGYQIFYGFFNLDYFNSESLSFCLWSDASALDMLAIKYVTILYTALLIITFVLIMNKCGGRFLGKCCRITTIKASVVHGISSFLMIGYSQCVNVSLHLLLQVHVYASRDEKFHPPSRVWFNSEIVHFSKEHLPYALPALFCLLTLGILPPLLLLIYPLLNKIVDKLGLEDLKIISFILKISSTSSIKPFLDSFQGCFKDNMRFFAGLYFLYRWMFLLIHICTVGFFEHYTTIGGMLVFILALQAIFQPYIKRAHNIIDVLLLCNLVFISSLSLFNFYRSTSPKIPNNDIIRSATVQMVLIYLPALVMTGILLIHFSKYIYHCLCKSQANGKSVFIPNRARKLKYLVRAISSQNESSDEEFTRDQLMDEDVEFRATCDYVEDRNCPPLDTY